jgi:NAD(P) transhydrogenase subunit alpha
VESLGGTFVAVMDEEFKNAQTAGGYAKEMSAEYQAKQAALTAETIKKQDIVITTALIPGRKAPILVSEEMIKSMKPGSVIVDLAAGAGGNTPLSKPDEVVEVHGDRRVFALCPQPVQFRVADRGQEVRPACDRLGR